MPLCKSFELENAFKEYEVEKILNMEITNKKRKYLIKQKEFLNVENIQKSESNLKNY